MGEQQRKRRLTYGLNVAVMTISLLIIIGLINWLATRHYKRWDFVESTSEALSQQTVNILKNLDKDIKVVYLYTEQYSEEVQEMRANYKKLLERYKSISPHFSYEMLDYAKNPKRVEDFLKELKDVKVYEGEWVVQSGDKVEKISETTESALTQAIIKLTTGQARTVCFTEGHGEHDPNDSDVGGYSVAAGDLRSENFSVKKINILKDGVPDSCTVVVVAGLAIPFREEERTRLQKWVEDGGKAMLLLEPVGVTGLEPLMSVFGITAEDTLLRTTDEAAMGVDPLEIYSIDYSSTHPITQALNQQRVIVGDSMSKIPTRMYKARSLKTVSNPPENIELIDLITTIDMVKAYPSGGHDGEGGKPLTDTMSFVVAVTAKKTLSSTKSETLGAMEEGEQKEGSGSGEQTARLAVFGDSDWAADGFMDLPSNRNIFLNTVAWLAEEEQTIGIRPREKKVIPITFAGKRNWLVMTVILLVIPVVLIVNAVLVWREKKRL